MARFQRIANNYYLTLSKEEFEKLHLSLEKDYDLLNAEQGLQILNKNAQNAERSNENAAEERVINLLKRRPLAQRVEGRFEKMLNDAEGQALQALLKNGIAEKYRLSEKYKHCVYKYAGKNQEVKQPTMPAASAQKEADFDSYSLKKDGFMIIKNENLAREISEQYYDLIKLRKLLGTRGFDGLFYIIYSDLYNKYTSKMLSMLKASKGCDISDISMRMGIDKNLAKAVCELLREQGDIIEKRKNIYCLVE